MYIESKFRLDYRNFETLPNQLLEALDLLNARIRQVEHVKHLQQKISDLELSLAAETKMIADDILRQNVFPRFGGYSDFIGHDLITQETVDQNPSFGNLAVAVQMERSNFKNFKDEKRIYELFKYQLDNFIWLFFEGGGVYTLDNMVVGYEMCAAVNGAHNDAYPPTFTYYFNVTNANSGKTYRVAFTFYDLNKAIAYNYMPSESRTRSSTDRFRSIRTAGFGQIICTVSEIKKSRNSLSGSPWGDENNDKIVLHSFDPLELAAFVRHVVIENGR